MSPDSQPSRGYGQACLSCRQKKRKCQEGTTKERCRLCERDGDDCVVSAKRPKPNTYSPEPTADLLQRYAEASDEQRLGILQSISQDPTHAPTPRKRQRSETGSALPHTLAPMQLNQASTSYQEPYNPELDAFAGQASSSRYPTVNLDIQNLLNVGNPQPSTHHDTHPPNDPTPTTQHNPYPPIPYTSPQAPSLYNHLTPTRPTSHYTTIISSLIQEITDDQSAAPINEVLLQTYFAWQAPQLMPVNRELFLRDLGTTPKGPYYSTLLLLAIYAQASRHVVTMDFGEVYADKAAALLSHPTLPPTIPTIQALLILAGRDLALGSTSGAWGKTGRAFRMIGYLGMEVDAAGGGEAGKEVGGRGEEVGMRRQLFWSAFAWDKFIALTLGRQPTFGLPPSQGREIMPVMVPMARRMWVPIYPDLSSGGVYPPQPALESETFFASCLLYMEIHQIIQKFYITGRHPDPAEDTTLTQAMSFQLLAWRKKVSAEILLDTAYLPAMCPPPHILTLNILYRAAWILLYRPMIKGSPHAQESCVSKSSEVHLLFKLHERTFGLRNITYLMAYVAYVSATIDVAQALCDDQSKSGPAVVRLELTLKVLTEAVEHTPGIQRSIHHLKQKLQANQSDRRFGGHASGVATPTTAHPSSAITVEEVATGLSMAQPLNQPGPFSTMGLGVGFDELFASLQPEYELESPFGMFMEEGGNSTRYMPFPDYDWTAGL